MDKNIKGKNSSLLSILKFIIGWPISLIALFFILKIIIPHAQTIGKNLNNINWFLIILSVISFILYYLIRAILWKMILKKQGYNIPLKTSSFFWEISELKRFVPGNIWSFLGRASLFAEFGIPAKTILKTIIIEVQFLLIGTLIIALFSIPFILNNTIVIMLGVIFVSMLTFAYIFSNQILNIIRIKPFYFIKHMLPNFSAKTKSVMILISCFYTILFCLGSFFSAISISYISPNMMIQIMGFFAFSFLIGYVSVFTPMGIGVREGIITIGLSKILTAAIAGFVSILARVIQLISEVLFLLLMLVWKNVKNKKISAIEIFITNHKTEAILGILIALYVVYFTSLSFLRHDNFYTGRYDLGNMDQAVWNTIHGRIFETTDSNGTGIISRLAFHADFILILLSPLYLLWENPKMLLLLQTIILATGSVFVFAIAKNILREKKLALTLSAIYLFNPAVQYTNLYDFHAVTLATTFLLGAFYFLLKNKILFLLLFLILAGLCKENIWLIIAIFGLYIGLVRKKIILGVSIFTVSFFIFYFLVSHIIPNVHGDKHFALAFYSEFGNSPLEVAKNVVLFPDKTLEVIFQKDQLIYLKNLFMPLGLLSLFSIFIILPIFPDLLLKLLSTSGPFHQIYYQYSAEITPFLFIGAILGIKNFRSWLPKIPTPVFIYYLLICTAFSSYVTGPLPISLHPNMSMLERPQKSAKEIKVFLNSIPLSYSVSATNNLGAHLSHREKIYTFPIAVNTSDYVLFLLNSQSEKQKDMIKKIRFEKNYIEIFKIENFVAFKKANL